jgi:hypothetical protein
MQVAVAACPQAPAAAPGAAQARVAHAPEHGLPAVGEDRLRNIRAIREPRALAGAERWMLDQREIWEQRLDRMQDYVEGLATNKEKL